MKARLALVFSLVALIAASLPTVANAGMHDGHDNINRIISFF